jgi:hypothetical protein
MEDFAIQPFIDYVFEPLRMFLRYWYNDPEYSTLAQMIVAFAYGLLLSPWSSGIFFLFGSIIVCELLAYVFTKGLSHDNLFIRAGIIYSSLAGFIIGRGFSLNLNETMDIGLD